MGSPVMRAVSPTRDGLASLPPAPRAASPAIEAEIAARALPSPPGSFRRRPEARFPRRSAPPPAAPTSPANPSLKIAEKQRLFHADPLPARRLELPSADGAFARPPGSFPDATEASGA